MIQAKRNIYAFGQKFLISCPQCSKQAILINHGNTAHPNIVFTCSSCASTEQWQQPDTEIKVEISWRSSGGAAFPAPPGYGGSPVYIGVASPPATPQKLRGRSFRLWLQTSCCGKNLWFLNSDHLSFAESYLQNPDELRSRLFDTENIRELEDQIQWLPAWLSEDKEATMACLKELRVKN